MLELTAIFEMWHLDDGNYPPLHKGMAVNLAFEIQPRSLSRTTSSAPLALHPLGEAEYEFVAEVILSLPHGLPGPTRAELIRLHPDQAAGLARADLGPNPPLAVLDSGEFRFYVEGKAARGLRSGMRLKGSGTLLLDYYVWGENCWRLASPPDLYYSLDVTRIRQVQVPDDFVKWMPGAKSLSPRLAPAHYGALSDLETMEGHEAAAAFCIVDFSESPRKDIPKTHRGAKRP